MVATLDNLQAQRWRHPPIKVKITAASLVGASRDSIQGPKDDVGVGRRFNGLCYGAVSIKQGKFLPVMIQDT